MLLFYNSFGKSCIQFPNVNKIHNVIHCRPVTGKIVSNVIVEGDKNKEEDEDDNFVVEESQPLPITESQVSRDKFPYVVICFLFYC